jgi:hypothetical protein
VFALSTAAPGVLCVVSPPAATGVPAWPDSEPSLVAGGGVVPSAGAPTIWRSPVEIFVKRMPVPAAAASSWTSTPGMSTWAGMALPSRTTSE